MRRINKNNFILWCGITIVVLFWIFVAIHAGIKSDKQWHFNRKIISIDTLITQDSLIVPASMEEVLLENPIFSTEGVLLHFKVENPDINIGTDKQNVYVNGVLILSEDKATITNIVEQILSKSSDKSCFFVANKLSKDEEKKWINFLIDNGVKQIFIPKILPEQNDKQSS